MVGVLITTDTAICTFATKEFGIKMVLRAVTMQSGRELLVLFNMQSVPIGQIGRAARSEQNRKFAEMQLK